MPKLIRVTEHETLRVNPAGDFKAYHYEALVKYNHLHDNRYFTVGPNSITFKQYVGVLKVGNLFIEIYPKLSRGGGFEDKWKKLLLELLAGCYRLKINLNNEANLHTSNLQLTDLFFLSFINELSPLVHRGLTKKYRLVEQNQFALKGKLVFAQHIRHNVAHQERFFVQHQTYDHEHLLNQALLLALSELKKLTSSAYIKRMANSLQLLAPEIAIPLISHKQLDAIKLNKKTKSHAHAFALAKLIIKSISPDISVGREPLVAILFDMNSLWEEYLFNTLTRHLNDRTVKRSSRPFFYSEKGNIHNKPDILIYKGDTLELIIDAKWKAVSAVKEISPADLRQVFAYLIQWNGKKGMLAYPSENSIDSIKGTYLNKEGTNLEDETHSCTLQWLPLFSENADKTPELSIKDSIKSLLPTSSPAPNHHF